MARFSRCALALLLLTATTIVTVGGSVATATAAVVAAETPLVQGLTTVTLNPGGGSLEDGSDGLSFSLNTAMLAQRQAWSPGQDSLWYRGTQQYCCAAGAPMLSIGETLFGQAGPAIGRDNWTSLTLVSTTGSTAVGDLTTTTGDAEAVVRYVATWNGRQYTLVRTIEYRYPNDFVTDSYSLTIPEGNTDPVKFYLGGDAAPGGSDYGYGIMLTSPVRSVISLNTSSGIQFGMREVSGSQPFDGATSQDFDNPYPAVYSGGDIGFVANQDDHDAGLMIQWNFGTAPGTRSAALQQFVNRQGTNLSATFDRSSTTPGTPVVLNLSIENTHLGPRRDLGVDVTLPDGMTVAAGASTNTCGGNLIAPEGATEINAGGGAVGGAANCVIAVPVVATAAGSYELSSANVRTTAGLTDNVARSTLEVRAPLSIPAAELDVLTVGAPTAQSVAADGTPQPTYAVTDGILPAGLSLDTDSGELTGTPRSAGPYSFVVTATNETGTAERSFTGTVQRGRPGLSGSADAATVEYGTAVTFAVADLPPAATGTVDLTTGDSQLCTVTLPSAGCAGPTDLPPGEYQVRAAYSGDANYLPRTETVLGVVVTPAESRVTGSLSSSTVPTGQRVDVTAAVEPSASRGTVSVRTGDLTLCTIELPETACATPDTLPPGSYPLSLTYSGDDFRRASTGSAGALVVSRATPTPTGGDYSSTYGEDVTFVLRDLPAAATGTITVSVDGTELCSYRIGDDPQSCAAGSALPSGWYRVVHYYSGDATFAPASATSYLTVHRVGTAVESPAEVTGTYGTALAVPVSGLPTGATGQVGGSFGDFGACEFDVGTATDCVLPADLPAGRYDLLVSYEGDSNHQTSRRITVVVIERAPTAIDAHDLSTVVRTPAGFAATGLPAAATGTVTVVGGPEGVLCSFDVPDADGCSTTGDTPAGSWQVTITYSGDGDHLGSAATVTFDVARVATRITTPGTLAGTHGTPTVITAGGLPGDATGNVTVRPTGPAELEALCSFSVVGADSCSLPAGLAAGEYALTVTYSGDDVYQGSAGAVTVVVARATTSVSTPATFSTAFGGTVTVPVQNLPAGATGTVTVSVGQLSCTVDAAAAGRSCAVATGMDVGSYPVTVTYPGDANYAGSRAAGSLSITQLGTGVIVATVTGAVYGAPTLLTLAGLPAGSTGTVTVTDGETVVCTIDVAITRSCGGRADLPTGAYDLLVSYSGDTNHAPSTKRQSILIAPSAAAAVLVAAVVQPHGKAPTFQVSGLPADATGTVTVASGGVVLCTLPLPRSSCSGPADLNGGRYPVSVSYGGDSNYLPSATGSTLDITPEESGIDAPAAVGGTVGASNVFAISGLPADATGTITVLSEGRVLCTITLPELACTLPELDAGTYDLDVRYSGDANYAPSATTSILVIGSSQIPGATDTDPAGTTGSYTDTDTGHR